MSFLELSNFVESNFNSNKIQSKNTFKLRVFARTERVKIVKITRRTLCWQCKWERERSEWQSERGEVENSPFRQRQKYVEKARRWRPSRSRATHAFLILFAEFVISLNLHINQGILITLTPHCQCQCQCKPMAKVVAVAKKEALEMSQSKSNVLKLGLSSS